MTIKTWDEISYPFSALLFWIGLVESQLILAHAGSKLIYISKRGLRLTFTDRLILPLIIGNASLTLIKSMQYRLWYILCLTNRLGHQYHNDVIKWKLSGLRCIPHKKGQWRFDGFFDLRLNKRLSKQSWGSWFEKLSRPSWRHSNDCYWYYIIVGVRHGVRGHWLMVMLIITTALTTFVSPDYPCCSLIRKGLRIKLARWHYKIRHMWEHNVISLRRKIYSSAGPRKQRPWNRPNRRRSMGLGHLDR